MYEDGKEEEGWSWKELDTANGRPTYERDGLKLLAAFIKHSDNKPPQQRLDCDKVQGGRENPALHDHLQQIGHAGAGCRSHVRRRRLVHEQLLPQK